MHPDEQLLRQVLDEAEIAYMLVHEGEHALARLVATPSFELTIEVQLPLLRVRAAAHLDAIDPQTDLPLLGEIARDWGIGNLAYDFEHARVVASVGLWAGTRASARRGLPGRLNALLAHLDEVLDAVAHHRPIVLAPPEADPQDDSSNDSGPPPAAVTLDDLARVLDQAGQPYRRMDHLSSLAFGASPPGVGPIVVHLVVVAGWLIGVRVLTLPPRRWPGDPTSSDIRLQALNASLPWGMLSLYRETQHCVFQGLIPMIATRLDDELVEFLVHAAIDAAPLLVAP